MIDNGVKLLTNSTERNLALDEKACFNDALHMMPKWILTGTATVKYIINIDTPVAEWKMHYITVTPTATNNILTKISYLKLRSLATVETDVFFRNYFKSSDS